MLRIESGSGCGAVLRFRKLPIASPGLKLGNIPTLKVE